MKPFHDGCYDGGKKGVCGCRNCSMVVRNQPFITYSDFDPFWLILVCF